MKKERGGRERMSMKGERQGKRENERERKRENVNMVREGERERM